MHAAHSFKQLGVTLLAALLCTAALAQDQVHQGSVDGAAQSLPTIRIGAGMYLIDTEVAQSFEEREIGLMHRPTMPTNHGMLFVFEEPAQQCFWMKNTLLPLSVAFVADDGTIVNVDEMKEMTLNSHCSAKPVRYVLEMNKGWFAKRGLKAGVKLTGRPFQK